MNTKIAAFLLTNLLLVTIVGCNEAKTTADASDPNSNNSSLPSTSSQDTTGAQNDAQSDTRKRQLDADVRAREQRNNTMGDEQKRDDSDLASEVRSKLEANIPSSKLTVTAKDGTVTVSGMVPNQTQLNKIKELGMEIKGVKNVTVDVTSQSN